MARPVTGFRFVLAAASAAAAFAFLTGCGGGSAVAPQPQNQANNPAPNGFPPGTVYITAAETAAKPAYTNFRYHVTAVAQPSGVHTMGVVYPGDMKNGGGAVLTAATEHDIFVNTTPAAVGTPATFQTDLNKSTFINVLNQYNGVTSSGKFPVSATVFSAAVATYSNVIDQDQLFAALHTAAKTAGVGFGQEYNVFLASGLDTCIDFGPCYSPDNPPAWVLCAYHGSVDFADLPSPHHVIFTIIPYQDVSGCGDVGLPGNSVANSTATTLSHEFSESVSDAVPNSGWFNSLFGAEIGDLCNTFRATETLNTHAYIIQPEYSNAVHGCFY